MSLIRSIDTAGLLRFYMDWRTGSEKDLSSSARLAVRTTPSVFSQTRRGLGWVGGGSRCVSMDPTGLQPSSSGTLLLLHTSPVINYDSSSVPKSIFGSIGGANRLQLYWQNGAVLIAYNGSVNSASAPAAQAYLSQPAQTVGAVFGGRVSDFYIDGVRFAGTNTLPYTGDPGSLLIGGTNFPYTVLSAACIELDGITDADIARLHRELVAGPTVVRRPSRHFSLPYPAKTPSEYAAEGIILDMDGRGNEHTGLRPATRSGQLDLQREGPFDEAANLGTNGLLTLPAGDTEIFNTGDWSVEGWMKWTAGTADIHTILTATPGYYIRGYTTNRLLVNSRSAAGANLTFTTPADTLVPGNWTHFCAQRTLVGSTTTGDVTTVIYIDSEEVTRSVSVGVGVTLPGAATPAIGETSGDLGLALAGLRYRKGLNLTPAEIRQEYLLGARKCLLDARVHSDGSCPVSLAAVGAGNELANGWKVVERGWLVGEEAPVNGLPGARYLTQTGAGTNRICVPSDSAYGAWLIDIAPSGSNRVFFIGSTSNESDANHDGYSITIDSTFNLNKTTLGVTSVLSSVAATITAGTRYKVWVTRRFDGTFNVWVNGGAYADWTLILSYKDSTFTSSKFAGAYIPVPNKLYGITSYLGEFTPFEGIRAGKLEGEIPEPFWTVTTTDTTQGWTMRLAAGAVYVFDWGDGQQEWHTGTGADQAITHTYASAGTYEIKVYTSNQANLIKVYSPISQLSGPLPNLIQATSLRYLQLNVNSLTGSIPDLSSNGALLEFIANTNLLTGSIPDLSANVALQYFYAYSNQITGYAPSVLSTTIIDFRADGNALTLAAVNAILEDFTTGAAGRPAAGTIDLSGGTNAAPTPAVLAAAQSALPGWTISTN